MTTRHINSLNLECLIGKFAIPRCHIAFFGASVTQQGYGYVGRLKERLKNYKFKLSQLGFGSLHLRDAVLLLETTILSLHSESPVHICILEWFTSAPDINVEDLEYIVLELQKRNILPVLLLLYNDTIRPEREATKKVYHRIAQEYGLPYLDIDSHIVADKLYPTDLFRDNTHLHDKGGVYIGDLVYEFFFGRPEKKALNRGVHFHAFEPRFVTTDIELKMDGSANVELKTEEEKKASGNEYVLTPAYKVAKGSVINIPVDIDSSLVGIWVLAGPDSGVIKIWDDQGNEEKMSVWDQWSHYSRFTIRRFRDTFYTRNNLKISLTDENPKYETCTRKIDQWPPRCIWILGWSVAPIS